MRPLPLASVLAFSAALALAGAAFAQGGAPPAPAAEVPSQLPRNVRPLHYRIAAVPDAANLRFTATAAIDIEVLQPTREISLNAAELDFARVVMDGEQARVSTNADAQTATFRFAERIAPGRHRLDIQYSGRINTQAAGLFALDYTTEQGPRRALFTQFEAPDARRFFPSWDEPNFRTPYDLSVTVPAGQRAISNMPEAGRQARGNWARPTTGRSGARRAPRTG